MKNGNDKKNGRPVGSEDFTGDIHLKIEEAENHTQVDRFCFYLKSIDNLRISSYNWSESQGLVISISLKDTVPLGDILRKMPLVEQVYMKKKKKAITVVLNTSTSGPTPEVTSACDELAAA